jgi:hypothetical protein
VVVVYWLPLGSRGRKLCRSVGVLFGLGRIEKPTRALMTMGGRGTIVHGNPENLAITLV